MSARSVQFNVTCDEYYASTTDVENEIVSCPFEDSYSNFSFLTCAFYQSYWCSAGVWSTDSDGDWEDEDSWAYGEQPSAYVLVLLFQC